MCVPGTVCSFASQTCFFLLMEAVLMFFSLVTSTHIRQKHTKECTYKHEAGITHTNTHNYLHSSSCRGLVRSQGHRHTWSCRECLHTSVHIHHCLAWHTHPPLKNTHVRAHLHTHEECRVLWENTINWHARKHTHLWRSLQQIRPCWPCRPRRTSSRACARWSAHPRACRSRRIDRSEGWSPGGRRGPPGSRKHSCHASRSVKNSHVGTDRCLTTVKHVRQNRRRACCTTCLTVGPFTLLWQVHLASVTSSITTSAEDAKTHCGLSVDF